MRIDIYDILFVLVMSIIIFGVISSCDERKQEQYKITIINVETNEVIETYTTSNYVYDSYVKNIKIKKNNRWQDLFLPDDTFLLVDIVPVVEMEDTQD